MESESWKGTKRDNGKEPETEWDSRKESEMELFNKMGSESMKWIERDSSKEPDIESEITTGQWIERDSSKEPEIESELTTGQGKLRKKEKELLKKMGSESGKGVGRDSGDSEDSGDEHHSSQSQIIKEIISLERERKYLLVSITPTLSGWKEIQSQKTLWRQPYPARDDGEEDLADYFNSMLQDMEDLGHRMLSMLDFLNKSNAPISICSYKASELHNTTVKLNMIISKEFNTDEHPEPMQVQEEDLSVDLLCLFSKYSQFPNNYENTLAQLVMEEDEDKKYEDVEVEEEEEEQEKDVSTMEYLKERMDVEQQFLANHREYWEDVWGSRIGRCGGFMDTTTLSPMHFTHYTPGTIPSPAAIVGSTLQIYSIKIKNLKGFNWPLRVYGQVAARDTVDRNRNILFSRSRCGYQELNGEDCSLCLIGPSRAIVAMDPVDFEVELRTVEETGSQDRALISLRHCLQDGPSLLPRVTDGDGRTSVLLSNHYCTAELTIERLDRSLQATIMGVHVVKGGWPFKRGCRVVCSWFPAAAAAEVIGTTRQVVLLDHRGTGMRRGSDNYLHLLRKVVSVEPQGTLRVAIEAYGKSGRCVAREGHVDFPIKHCQTSMDNCKIGNATVEVVVAWSLLVSEKVELVVGCAAV